MCANCRGDDKRDLDAMSQGSVRSKSTAAVSKISKTSKQRPPEGDREESKSSRKRQIES